MNKITLKVVDKKEFILILDNIIKYGINIRYKTEENSNVVKIEIDKNDKTSYYTFIESLACYLLKSIAIKYGNKWYNVVFQYLVFSNVIVYSMVFKIDRYFECNNIFNEKSFLLFNLLGLDEDIKKFIAGKEVQNEYTEALIKTSVMLSIRGMKTMRYKELTIDFDDKNNILLKNNKKVLTIDKVEKMYEGILNHLKKEENIYKKSISFCYIVSILFQVETIYIPKKYQFFYEDMMFFILGINNYKTQFKLI